MPKIVVVGCGVVGAFIAYELSQQIDADIIVLDKQQPAQGSTGAALGVLMGAISGRVKGRTWRLREASIRRYQTVIAELKAQGYFVPFNTQGIVSLCDDEDKLPRWRSLQEKREQQGWPLEIWSPSELQSRCPHIDLHTIKAAIYSPKDAQVHPAQLTHALVQAAESKGVTFHWNAAVTKLHTTDSRCTRIQTTSGEISADWVVLSAGLGSSALSNTLKDASEEALELIPVLGQAMEIQVPAPLGDPNFQPVINGDDIQFVPLGQGRYWMGATVEFPDADGMATVPEAEGLEQLKKGAEGFCSALAQARILKTWSGLRPRPVGQPAPVIKPLVPLENTLLATGHYRNGVLLAPATAQQVCNWLQESLGAEPSG